MGAEQARLVLSEGATVVIGDVLDDEGRSVATQLGDGAHYLHLDVTHPEQWAFAVAEAVRKSGRLDGLVNTMPASPAERPSESSNSNGGVIPST